MSGSTPKTISQKAYNARNRTRKWIRFVGLGVAVMAFYFAAFLLKDSLRGAVAAGFGLHLLGVAAFILSFFVPKLPRLRKTVCNGHAVCAGCSTLLDALKKEEIFISSVNGMQYCDVCAKRLEAGSLPNEFQDPDFKRSAALWQKVDSELAAIEGTHATVPREPAPAQERRQTYSCARCKKQIAEQDCVWVGNHRFCRDCAKASERVFPDVERYREPKPRTEQSPADRTMGLYPPDGTTDPIGLEKKCSCCGREMSGFGLTIRDAGYRLCRQCREPFKRFRVFHYSFNPCPQYDEYEDLNVYVAEHFYLLLLEGAACGAGETFATLPFGSFAKSSATQIAEMLNSISPGGFGIRKRWRLSADDIRNNEDVRALIDYDRSRCSTLRFSGSGHGDHVTLRIQSDNTVMVDYEYVDRFAGGGYSLPMPQDLVDNYDQDRFTEWLRANFRSNNRPIEICLPTDESTVKRFLSDGRNLYPTSGPANAESPLPSVEGYVLSFHTDAGAQMAFRLVAVQHVSFLAGSSMGTSHSTWLFLSYVGKAPFLLEYEYSSEGVGWFAYPLSEENVRKIQEGPSQDEQKKNAAYWLWQKIAWTHLDEAVRSLHPDDIDAVKNVLYPLYTWHGKLTDEEIMVALPNENAQKDAVCEPAPAQKCRQTSSIARSEQQNEEQKPANPCTDKNASAEAPDIEGAVLSFHSDAKEQMSFRLVAVQRISGVPGSTMVEAHSTWIFFSYMGETPYLLEYDYSSEWYPEWLATPITQEDVQKIKQGPQQDAQKEFAAYWLWHGIMLDRRKDKGRLPFLHPDDIEAAKRVLYPLQTWHGKLTDEDILGGGPLDLPAAEQKKETDE